MPASRISNWHLLFRSKRVANEGAWLITGVAVIAIAVGVGWHAALGKAVLNERRPAPSPLPLAVPAERAYVPAVFHVRDLPPQVDLDVPFMAQAPYGDWSSPYDEACEEASVLMAVAWMRGQTLSAAQADVEILRLVDFENYYFGYNSDTALRETLKLITDYYHYPHARIFYDISIDDIRRALVAGDIVILPVAGALLLNPNYVSPPPYHMVVVKGYDEQARELIVNDPGTRHGEDYRYPYDTLWNAIHDWTGSDKTVMNGRKGMIVVGAGEPK